MRSETEIRCAIDQLVEIARIAKNRGDEEVFQVVTPCLDALAWTVGEDFAFELMMCKLRDLESENPETILEISVEKEKATIAALIGGNVVDRP